MTMVRKKSNQQEGPFGRYRFRIATSFYCNGVGTGLEFILLGQYDILDFWPGLINLTILQYTNNQHINKIMIMNISNENKISGDLRPGSKR